MLQVVWQCSIHSGRFLILVSCDKMAESYSGIEGKDGGETRRQCGGSSGEKVLDAVRDEAPPKKPPRMRPGLIVKNQLLKQR